ncbi:MAG: bifunctional protein-serine/threonine kinase/phosphatase [Gammaproteobacteria bacterium]|jgi:eukaryotic-like serine/threonine-protein kinase|nr:bifunctional protein-serine/threonine kinase/phosphatase [Candidatus Falkowbacteria bacterium]MBT5223375.1 bifunctional protein-serine/threonine kinase/phosphatase [Gammaproteobacteria bacterium]MBT5825351.1 bifunctional protein-serine/threonine kinase/phosphatase [Gammaproteobacteria bacterium]MBT6420043.1 bifunctional protein-serine/threonine kinase/phosphatase [Gammaproteobacteria bacterium]MBT6576157.1 bifunctional protein-serine/threonine kinase/phosphatase [Gammaproteobacteria bacteriu
MTAKLKVSVGSYSDKGIKEENQDSIGHMIPTNLNLLSAKGAAFTLADGVSSSSEAKQASQTCVTGFLNDYFSTPDSWSVKKSGGKVLTSINTWLYSQSNQFQDISRGLASTFCGLILKSTTAHLFHVGDSRIYQLRANSLEQLTTDHRIHMPGEKEYLGRAMGVDYRLDIDYRKVPTEVGDLFFISTDGVHDYLSDKEIKKILTSDETNLTLICEQIVAHSLKQGSLDNVSCQLLRIDQLPSQDADEIFSKLTALPFPPELYEGVVLDGYRITRELHASSTSQLYLAIDTDTDEKVVIKTPSVNFEDDPAYLERFQLEEWAGRRLDCPHVIRTIEQHRPRRFLYYVMEYIEGKTLEQWIEDQTEVDLTMIRNIVSQAISGLRAFHRLDMLHQDIKPGNIMITAEGLVKIVDFGSTKIAGIADISTPIERKELLGTKHYTAPEYLIEQSGTTQSDLFSLGCIIYEMITAKLPYGDGLAKAADQRALNRLKYIPISNHIANIPHWVDKAVRTAVQIDPDNRYEKLSELESDLRKPNPNYLKEDQLPLLERNPLGFWKAFAGILFVLNLILAYLLLR